MEGMEDAILNPTKEFESPDYYLQAALKKLSTIDTSNFDMYSIRGVTGGTRVVVGPVTTFKKGPRKGKAKYGPKSETYEVLVSTEDFENEKRLFERETGRCHECYGNKIAWNGWAADKGNYYRTCNVCKGTGLANGTN